MTMESDLFNLLKGLVSNRVYPDLNDALTKTTPYIVWQQVGGQAPTFMERASPSKKNGRIQIAVWADTRAASLALGLQVEAAMVAATVFDAKPSGASVSTYDEATKLRGSLQDFSVWSNR